MPDELKPNFSGKNTGGEVDDTPRDAAIEKALDEVNPEGEQQEVAADESVDETPDDDLFAEADESVDEDDEPLFEDEKKPETVPYKRFKKVISERNEAREQNVKLETKLATVQDFVKVYDENYARQFQNPAEQLEFDASIMGALENLSKTDPSVRSALDAAKTFAETGQVTTKSTPTPTNDTPKTDPNVEALLRREAGNNVADALTGVKPYFQKQITQELIDKHGVALEGVTPQVIRAAAREHIATHGLDKSDVLVKPAQKAEVKPDTGGDGGRPAEGTKESGDSGGKPKTPQYKSLDELQEARAARFQEVFSS